MKNVHWPLKLIILHFLLLCSRCVSCIKKDNSLHRVRSTKAFSVACNASPESAFLLFILQSVVASGGLYGGN